ncbi:MFS transporter [Sphingopyxis flava]|uniref:Nitrate/nitrite transporter NarK n=1 Tax=Sphingopyxis flava TaxID=1507287 RepID=A0A1T5FGX3_9SPHN|nr:MFS transporter [Sphingopyxis flava]SKB95362.1 Nitrate/nitrite transporter NarK [Sphingopyxis flava]
MADEADHAGLAREGRLAELKRSWRVLLICSLGGSVGAAAFPLFLVPVIGLRLEAQFGWSRLDTSSLTSIAFLGGALGAPIAGWFGDRRSMKGPVIASMAAVGAMLILASFAPRDVAAWQAGIFVFMLLGAGTLSASFCKIICEYFDAMRGLALGITIGSVSFMSAALLPWFGALIDRVGTGEFLLRAGAVYFVAILPLLLWLLPGTRPAGAASAEAERGADGETPKVPPRALWLLGTAGVLLSVITGSAAHLAAVAADGGHIDPALVGSVFAAGVMVSRPAAGFLIDLVDARRVGAAAAALAAAGLALTALSGDSYVLLAALLLAAAVGSEFDVVAYLASHYVAPGRFGRLFGWMYAGMLVAAAAGPLFIAVQRDVFGAYRIPFLSAAVLAGLACAILASLPRYHSNGSRS